MAQLPHLLLNQLRAAGRQVRTIKARVTAGALVALAVGITLTDLKMAQVAEANLLQQEQLRQHEDAQQIAAVIGRRVAELQRALRLTADRMDRGMFQDPARLESFFDNHPVLRAQFGSVSALGLDGQALLLFDKDGPRRPGLSVADRAYFKQAVATRLPVISEPIASRVTGNPTVIFAQSLADENGIWGVIAASMILTSRDLIEDLSENRTGNDDRIIVVTDDNGRILAHPQSARILQGMQTEPRLLEAWGQWTSDGKPLLRNAGTWTSSLDVIAMAGEPLSGWRVWSARSQDTVLAHLEVARREARMVAAAFGAAVAGLLMTFLWQQLRPLARLQQRAALLETGGDGGPWPVANGEIGDLTRTLRQVWEARARVERINAEVLLKLSSVMAASPIGLAFVREQRFELVSAEFCRLLDASESDLLGQHADTVFSDPSSLNQLRAESHPLLKTGQPYQGDWRIRTFKSREFWARIRSRAVVQGDPAGGSIWSVVDVTEQLATRQELEQAALADVLTGLTNRRGFETALASAFSKSVGPRTCTVVVLDLDRFKAVNDTGGHAAGDAILRAVAQCITAHVRGSDLVARMGGDEFALLLPGCDEVRAEAIARKVLKGIVEIRLPWTGRIFTIGASLGVATLSPSHETAAAWLADADAACYEAKNAGRNTVRVTMPAALCEE